MAITSPKRDVLPMNSKTFAGLVTLLCLGLSLTIHADDPSVLLASDSGLTGSKGYENPYPFRLNSLTTLELSASGTFGNVEFYITPADAVIDPANPPPTQYHFNRAASVDFPNIPAGSYKLTVLGGSTFGGVQFNLKGINPVNVVLLLHGFQGAPSSWDTFVNDVGEVYGTAINAPSIYGGVILDPTDASPLSGSNYDPTFTSPAAQTFYIYRVKFGAYDAASPRTDVLNQTASQILATGVDSLSGDYEAPETLGTEVQQAVDAILQLHPSAQIALVAHSRGGLAARSFLQSQVSEINSVIGLVTLGTPHDGSYFGRVNPYLAGTTQYADASRPFTPVDYDTWSVARAIRGEPTDFLGFLVKQVHAEADAFRPTVADLATGGLANRALKKGAHNLPIANFKYGCFVYSGRPFGKLPDGYDIFNGVEVSPNPKLTPPFTNELKISDSCRYYLIGDADPQDITSDGIVESTSQDLRNLHTAPLNAIRSFPIVNSHIFHTDEHDRTVDIIQGLGTLFFWHIAPE